jgi:hypothetical protein
MEPWFAHYVYSSLLVGFYAPALVPLEAWFWYMLFLDLLSAKLGLKFLIELIE